MAASRPARRSWPDARRRDRSQASRFRQRARRRDEPRWPRGRRAGRRVPERLDAVRLDVWTRWPLRGSASCRRVPAVCHCERLFAEQTGPRESGPGRRHGARFSRCRATGPRRFRGTGCRHRRGTRRSYRHLAGPEATGRISRPQHVFHRARQQGANRCHVGARQLRVHGIVGRRVLRTQSARATRRAAWRADGVESRDHAVVRSADVWLVFSRPAPSCRPGRGRDPTRIPCAFAARGRSRPPVRQRSRLDREPCAAATVGRSAWRSPRAVAGAVAVLGSFQRLAVATGGTAGDRHEHCHGRRSAG